MLTEEQAERKLIETLVKLNKEHCPGCRRIIDRGDVAWNNACTEAGTDYSSGIIQCQACDTEIAYWESWWPWCDSFEEFIEEVLPDLISQTDPQRGH